MLQVWIVLFSLCGFAILLQFFYNYDLSYWNINKYSLAFDFENKLVPFAIDLNNEAKKLLKETEQFIKN